MAEFFALDAAFSHQVGSEVRVLDDAHELLGHLVGIVGAGIKGGIAAGLRHGRDIGGDDRGVATHGFKNRDAEPLEVRHVHRRDGVGIEGREVLKVGIGDEMDAVGKFLRFDFGHDLVVVAAALTTHDDQMDVLRQLGYGLDNGALVLAFLDGAYAYHIFFGQVVHLGDVVALVDGDGLPEDGVA